MRLITKAETLLMTNNSVENYDNYDLSDSSLSDNHNSNHDNNCDDGNDDDDAIKASEIDGRSKSLSDDNSLL